MTTQFKVGDRVRISIHGEHGLGTVVNRTRTIDYIPVFPDNSYEFRNYLCDRQHAIMFCLPEELELLP